MRDASTAFFNEKGTFRGHRVATAQRRRGSPGSGRALKWRRSFCVVEQRGAPALGGGGLSAAATDDAVAISQSR